MGFAPADIGVQSVCLSSHVLVLLLSYPYSAPQAIASSDHMESLIEMSLDIRMLSLEVRHLLQIEHGRLGV